MMLLNRAYYLLKPVIPWHIRIAARRILAKARIKASADVWPIDEAAGATPPGWPGWPEGKQFAFVLTHDVERLKGLQRVERLMDLESRNGFRSSFNLVPGEEYEVSEPMLRKLHDAGFEVGVHGLEHDGKLYNSKSAFARKASRINSYLKRWGASGFRSPLMQHRLGWLYRLDAEYDASTFDTDPFEPEPDGVRSIFPFWVPSPDGGGFVELPYTLAQDFTLFVVLRQTNIDIWKKKLDWIAKRGGMAMLITHPDYMSFDGSKTEKDEFPVSLYEELLKYVRERYKDQYWAALPHEVNSHYRASLPIGRRNTRRRVCMIAYTRYDADNRVRRYAESLAARGDIVDVVALESAGRDADYRLNGVNVFGIQHREKNEAGKWSYARQLLRFEWRAFKFVSQRHIQIQYDLVHVHNVPDVLVFSAIYPKLTGAKVILDIHDLVPELFEEKFKSSRDSSYVRSIRLAERWSASFADHVIISNHLWQDRLTSRSVSAEKCSVFVNNVDTAIFSRRTRTRDDGKIVLLFPGTFQPHQGLDVAIRALARLTATLPSCELHLYGGGGGRSATEDLTKLASALGLNGRVRFFDSVPLDSIPDLMANADIGVVPKRADGFGNEAYSTKIMEFMSQGVPVVASRTAVDSYYFSDDTVGFFKSGDDEDMARILLNVIEDRDLRDRMSKNGLEYAARNGWDTRKTEYLELVDALCTERFEAASAKAPRPREIRVSPPGGPQ
jgi:glycosyltransferase involved in cell wall biosynthesis